MAFTFTLKASGETIDILSDEQYFHLKIHIWDLVWLLILNYNTDGNRKLSIWTYILQLWIGKYRLLLSIFKGQLSQRKTITSTFKFEVTLATQDGH